MASSQDPVTLDGFSTVQALRKAKPGQAPRPTPASENPETAKSAVPSPQTARIRHTSMPARHPIRCYHCGFEFVHTGRLEKVLCHKCRMFLSTDPQTLDGIWSGRMQTLGTITVAASGHVKSGEVAAMDLILHGRVSGGRIDVMRRLELHAGSSPDLTLFRYTELTVHAGMTLVPADPIRCASLIVAGEVEATVECSGCVTIAATGLFRGSIRSPSLVIEDGASVEADVIIGNDAAQPANAA